MQFQQNGRSGSFIDLARLQPHDAILEDVDFADAVGSCGDIQLLDNRIERQCCTIQCHR